MQKTAMDLYAESKPACIEMYRDVQRECQKTDLRKLERMALSGTRDDSEQMMFMTSCMLLAALHQTIYDKPMKLYRARDMFMSAAKPKHGKHARGTSKAGPIKLPVHEGGQKPGVIEGPMCFLKRDGSLHCTLARDTGLANTPVLNVKSILGVNGLVTVRQGVVENAVNSYEQILEAGKEQLQSEYRNIYRSCSEFVKARGRTISSQEWTQFQEDCIRLVALRKVLYDHPIPYEDRRECEALAAKMFPNIEYVASDLKDVAGDASASHRPASAGHKDVGSTSSVASGSGGFVRSAKAQELYGESCLLGDENTNGADIQFKDIAHEPYVTLILEDVLDAPFWCVTNGGLLAQMLVKARRMIRSDREGAEMTCSLLLKECVKRDFTQLMNLVRIGSKQAEEDYQRLMDDCLFHVMLKCLLEGKPIEILIGRSSAQSFDKAEATVINDRCAAYFMNNLSLKS